MENLRYGLKPSKPDSRDFVYEQGQTAIRPSVDLRGWDSPIEDQSSLGSCVGNAIANAYELEVKKLYPEYFAELSKLFIYYNARLLDNAVKEDVGAYIRDGLKAVKLYGVCTEMLWPYDIDKFDDQPPPMCYANALRRTTTQYRTLATLRDMLETLSADKPVVIGMAVYLSFDRVSKEDPVIPMPTAGDPYQGGHAVTVVGYDIDKKQFLIKNSYGTDWGDGGYGWMPFDYLRTEGFEKWRFEISDQVPKLVAEAVVEEPVVEEVVVDEPLVEIVVEETIVETIVEEVVIEELVDIEPIVEESVVAELVIEELIIEEPVVEEAIEEPIVEAMSWRSQRQIINQFSVFNGLNGIGLKRFDYVI